MFDFVMHAHEEVGVANSQQCSCPPSQIKPIRFLLSGKLHMATYNTANVESDIICWSRHASLINCLTKGPTKVGMVRLLTSALYYMCKCMQYYMTF